MADFAGEILQFIKKYEESGVPTVPLCSACYMEEFYEAEW